MMRVYHVDDAGLLTTEQSESILRDFQPIAIPREDELMKIGNEFFKVIGVVHVYPALTAEAQEYNSALHENNEVHVLVGPRDFKK